MNVTLPDWAPSLRAHQGPAIDAVVDGFEQGFKVCFLDAPTGSGKTLIGDVVRQRVTDEGIYVCSGIELQHQVERDFDYPVLKGRNNYTTLNNPEVTCDKCLGPGQCHWCEDYDDCPYVVAKATARAATCPVLNTSYLLYEGNRTAKSVFSGRGLVIADECDLLEGELMRFTELRVGAQVWRDAGVSPPREKQHYTTIQKKLVDELIPRLAEYEQSLAKMKGNPWAVDRLRRVRGALWSARFAVDTLADGNWVRDSYQGGLLMKPVTVAEWGQRYLWSRGDRWLAMSGTIISPAQMATDLGLADHEWFSVSVPMTFPVENRPIYVSPVANVTYTDTDRDMPRLLAAIEKVLERHPDERVLIHSVSYKLTDAIARHVKGLRSRPVWHYMNKAGRSIAVERYRKHPRSVLVAPSLDRGVDFKDEDCRVVVVAKIPSPNLDDPQINARLRGHGAEGRHWYQVQTIRTIVQMTGRGVRSEDDHAVSYVLDRQMLRLWREHRGLFPEWWRDAVVMNHRL